MADPTYIEMLNEQREINSRVRPLERTNAWRDEKINELLESSGGENSPTNWDSIEGKPTVIAAGDTPADARSAIGAGTSSIVVGTGASNAAAGNHNHAIAADAASGLAAAANLQAFAVAISARIKAIEDSLT